MTNPLPPGEHRLSLTVAGRPRDVLLYVPDSLDPDKPAPLILAFHGAGGNAQITTHATGWSQKADEVGCLVAYPEGVRPHPDRPPSFMRNAQFWNIGSGVGTAEHQGVDDIAFIRALLARLSQVARVDANRTYACGFSNGAALAMLAGMELSEHFAAVGAVAGGLWRRSPIPERPVSLLYITGAADPLNPRDGGVVESPWGPVRARVAIDDVIKMWARWIGAPEEPDTQSPTDGVRIERYGPGWLASAVEYCTIEGAGHVWPGGQPIMNERLAGKMTDKINATDVLWDFFRKHPRV